MIAAITSTQVVLWSGLCAVFVVLSGLYSGSETGLYCVNRLRLRLASHEKDRRADRLLRLLADEPGLLFTTLFGTNLANYLAPACLTVVFLQTITAATGAQREHLAELYTTLILTPVVFIFGEVVPKNVFQRHADRFMPRVSSILALTHRAVRTTGIVGLQRVITDLATRRLPHRAASGSALYSRLGMYQMLREGAAAGALSRTQVFMLERIHVLQSIRVGSVMVPRSATVMLNVAASKTEIEKTVRNSKFSRMPVYQGDRRRVLGVVHILDLLSAGPDGPLTTRMRPPVELLPSTPVIEALSTLQRRHRRMAIVVDKWGHCVGIITVKDLVEEIVGELAAW